MKVRDRNRTARPGTLAAAWFHTMKDWRGINTVEQACSETCFYQPFRRAVPHIQRHETGLRLNLAVAARKERQNESHAMDHCHHLHHWTAGGNGRAGPDFLRIPADNQSAWGAISCPRSRTGGARSEAVEPGLIPAWERELRTDGYPIPARFYRRTVWPLMPVHRTGRSVPTRCSHNLFHRQK